MPVGKAIEVLLQDLRYSLRQLRRTPGFALVAVLTLALGIGANTAIFSVMNAVLWRFLPVPEPQQLFFLQVRGNLPSNSSQTGNDNGSFTEYTFEQLRTRKDVFSDLMAFVPLGIPRVAVRYGAEPEEAQGDMVSGNFFSGLGVQLVRGRGFTVDEEKQHAQVAVLGYGYWTRRFARNPSAIGQTIYIKGVAFTILGVAPPEFAGVETGTTTDIWIPLQNRPDITAWGQSAQDGQSLYGSTNWWSLMMIGRLKSGVTEKQAVAQLNPAFQQLAYHDMGTRDAKEEPPSLYFVGARGVGTQRDGMERQVFVLMAMVGLVLVIACGNVAMLLVARNTNRRREFSLRMSLGASRGRLFRQLLTESLLLVAAGALLGWLFALWSTGALARWSELDMNVAPDSTVLIFTLAISAFAALIFGLAPLRNAVRVPVGLAMKTGAAASSQDKSRLRVRHVVVALQMAFCLMLLVGAGLLVRTLRNLQTADLGMRTTGLLVFGVSPPQSASKYAEVVQFYQTLLDRLRTLPGVESATLMQNRIGSGWANNTQAIVDGSRPEGEKFSPMRWNAVGPDYFHVLGANLLLGRDFNDADSAAAPKVVIVNHNFGERYLAGHDPIGHHISLDGPKGPQYSIIGVAADIKYTGVREKERPMAYFPYTQLPGVGTMHVEVRTRANPIALLPDVKRIMHSFGPDLPLLQPTTQEEQFRESFSQERLFAKLSSFFGLLAVLLVATGLFGTLAYQVNRRTAEIGVRMALGAQRGQVLWMVLRESLILSVAGAAVGLPLAFGLGRLLRSTLYGVGPADALTFIVALLGVAAVALIASWVPARRASSVDPIVALRYE
jgi:predicted permease